LGWTHTVNTYDGWDAYELKLAKGGYLFDGKVRSLQKETLPLKVKQKNGKLIENPLVVEHSIHGPVLKLKNGKTIALRVAGLDRPGVLEQWWDMARAKDFNRFQKVLQRLQLPMFTVMYADRQGHIMHLFNGQVPIRRQGDFEYWEGMIPGDTSKTLWTKTHSYSDLPKVIDPKSGWLQNTNDTPWTTTFPLVLNPDNYPAYIAPKDFMDFRSQRSAKMLDENKQISFQEMIDYKYSTRMELADRILDDLIPAAEKNGNELARQAAKVLKSWDRQANSDSRGAVLFAAWYEGISEDIDNGSAFRTPWNQNSPGTTPDGLANPEKTVAVLEAAAEKVQKTYKTLDISWGSVFRFKSGKVNLPANGGGGELGIFRVIDFAPLEDGRFQSVGGDSYIAAIEFSDPVRAMSLTSYGNSTQPNLSDVGDRLQLSAQKKLHPVWRSRQEIMTHLEERQVF
jgi:acyl-homoserine-lactone acylase